MDICWDEEKNRNLKRERGIGFEDVENMILGEEVLDLIVHHNQEKYAHQEMYVIRFENYIYYVPFIETEDEIFLKTIIPSRELTKKYNTKT